jgi:hypothetical protein
VPSANNVATTVVELWVLRHCLLHVEAELPR